MKKSKLCALALIAALCLGLCACAAKDPSVGSVNGVDIPYSEYEYYATSLQQMYESSYSTTVESLDAYSTEDDTETFSSMLRSSALEYCVQNRLFAGQVEKMGLDNKDTEDKYIDQMLAYYAKSAGSEEAFEEQLKTSGVSMDTMKSVLRYAAKQSILSNALFGTGGTQEITETTVADYYSTNYVRVQHILLATIDLSTSEALSDDAIAKKKALSEELQKRIADGEDFTALMNEYSEDTGLESNPDGYTFDLQNNNYMESFSELAGQLAVGEVGVCESSYGIHIMKRFPLPEDSSSYTDTITSTLKTQGLQTMLEGLRSDADIQTNEEVYSQLKFY